MLPCYPVEILEYLDWNGHSPCADWFESLSAPAAAKVAVAMTRLAQGNFANVKGVRGGVYECRINFGPGFRIYLGKDGGASHYSARGWNQETTAEGHRGREGQMAGLQEEDISRVIQLCP